MELEDFVATSIEQVMNGVKRAQGNVSHGIVSPHVSPTSHENVLKTVRSGAHAFLLRFDVAVRATQEKEGGGGAKLKVASFVEVGGGGEATTTDESVSRIQFEVPISYPIDAESRREHEEAIEAQKREFERTVERSAYSDDLSGHHW